MKWMLARRLFCTPPCLQTRSLGSHICCEVCPPPHSHQQQHFVGNSCRNENGQMGNVGFNPGSLSLGVQRPLATRPSTPSYRLDCNYIIHFHVMYYQRLCGVISHYITLYFVLRPFLETRRLGTWPHGGIATDLVLF